MSWFCICTLVSVYFGGEHRQRCRSREAEEHQGGGLTHSWLLSFNSVLKQRRMCALHNDTGERVSDKKRNGTVRTYQFFRLPHHVVTVSVIERERTKQRRVRKKRFPFQQPPNYTL